jgi:hypothetical protein
MVALKLDWCSHQAAKLAVERWHYSRSLPQPPIVRIGAWEDGVFIGCILFARGAASNLLKPYGLSQAEGCELVRVALGVHRTPVSRIMSISIKMLRKLCPGLRLIVSFADPSHGHHGGIYQATGWIFCGQTSPAKMYEDKNGKLWHSRMISTSGLNTVYGKKRRVLTPGDCRRIIQQPGKYRYLYPLDARMREKVSALAKPYPKKKQKQEERAGSVGSDTLARQAREGSANLTPALNGLLDKRDAEA